MNENLGLWITDQLSHLLKCDAADDISMYLLSMDSKADMEEYMQDLLDLSNHKHKHFLAELLKRWKPQTRSVDQTVPDGITAYKKLPDEPQASSVKVSKIKNKSEYSSITVRRESSGTSTPAKNTSQSNSFSPSATTSGESLKPSPSQKTKYVPLYGSDGKDKSVIQIPGRHPCVCQGHKHGLVNNCLTCGRVVCKQEGSGPCVFCGNLVCTEEELEIITRGSRKGEKLQESLMRGTAVPKFPSTDDAQAKKAKEHKDKLISFDKTSAKRTKVIDDEADYYATGSKWLSSDQRKVLQKKKDARHAILHGSQRDRKITFDFAGRKLIDSREQELEALMKEEMSLGDMHVPGADLRVANPSYMLESHKPQFQQSNDQTTSVANHSIKPPTSKRSQLRLQDKGLQEVVDGGMCLSMHQPWASLLVAGIKMHEGRTWYSAHRGKLWITATAQKPSDLEIQTLETNYKTRLGADVLFPKTYPISCLLGCVDVVDVLPYEEYLQQYPDGESSSPYVFICENAQELSLKFPIKGEHKIYKLDSQIHKAAKMGLQITGR